jgi:hypothetical protein
MKHSVQIVLGALVWLYKDWFSYLKVVAGGGGEKVKRTLRQHDRINLLLFFF